MSYDNFINQIEKLVVEESMLNHAYVSAGCKDHESRRQQLFESTRKYLNNVSTKQLNDESWNMWLELLNKWQPIVKRSDRIDFKRIKSKNLQLKAKRKFLIDYGKRKFNLWNYDLNEILNSFYNHLFDNCIEEDEVFIATKTKSKLLIKRKSMIF